MAPYVGRGFGNFGGGEGGGAEEASVEWDGATKHTGYTLSNGNLTVTVTDDGGGRLDNSSIRAVTSRNSGKRYVEIDADSSHASQYGYVGLATSLLSAINYVGQAASSWGYQTSGTVFNNAGLIQSYGAWVSFQPAWFGIAVDFDAGKAWFAMEQTGGSQFWQGSADPVTGANPAFTFAPGTSLYPAWTGGENTDYAIIRSTLATFHFTPPAGFSSWATP